MNILRTTTPYKEAMLMPLSARRFVQSSITLALCALSAATAGTASAATLREVAAKQQRSLAVLRDQGVLQSAEVEHLGESLARAVKTFGEIELGDAGFLIEAGPVQWLPPGTEKAPLRRLPELLGVSQITEDNLPDMFRRMVAPVKEDGAAYEFFMREHYRLRMDAGAFMKDGAIDRQAMRDDVEAQRNQHMRLEMRFAELKAKGGLAPIAAALNNALAYAEEKGLTFRPAQVRTGLTGALACVQAPPADSLLWSSGAFAESCSHALFWLGEKAPTAALFLDGQQRALIAWDGAYAQRVYRSSLVGAVQEKAMRQLADRLIAEQTDRAKTRFELARSEIELEQSKAETEQARLRAKEATRQAKEATRQAEEATRQAEEATRQAEQATKVSIFSGSMLRVSEMANAFAEKRPFEGKPVTVQRLKAAVVALKQEKAILDKQIIGEPLEIYRQTHQIYISLIATIVF